MTIAIIINGAKGRMGQTAAAAIEAHPTLHLAGQTDQGDDLAAAIKEHDATIVVDFTTAEHAFDTAKTIINAGAHPVIGTSGFLPEHIDTLKKLCAEKQLGGIIAPNFSIGAVLLMQFAEQAAKYFPHVEVIEMHHDGKLDSPSGTAVKTAEVLSRARQKPQKNKGEMETIPHARGADFDGIPIHSVRLPGMVAHEMIMFGGIGQSLTLRHDSIDRQSFMPGLCMACEKVTTLTELIYGLEHIL